MSKDTDITPLVAPEVLFQTEAYQRDGAMFWPDHWSHDCWPYGQSAWPTHVVLHLLQLEYNMSEPRFCHVELFQLDLWVFFSDPKLLVTRSRIIESS